MAAGGGPAPPGTCPRRAALEICDCGGIGGAGRSFGLAASDPAPRAGGEGPVVERAHRLHGLRQGRGRCEALFLAPQRPARRPPWAAPSAASPMEALALEQWCSRAGTIYCSGRAAQMAAAHVCRVRWLALEGTGTTYGSEVGGDLGGLAARVDTL
ncbi:unnamed protein product [Ostreobium quekettii]|uniref:Uncharacterized protein n=1 Tax=Ostreobium quekettii TaxID=121088 RepID=A0A8S1J3V0_9CHLO|nr:unnamed protein product [Ostreobium quekettii]